MKRTKLPASVHLSPGPMPPTSTWYEVPRCFACDDPIKSHRFSTSLLLGHTQYSHSSIPGKLGEYIGDGFVVVVTSEDALCRNCMNLLNTMDRLEEELKEHRTRLVGNLRRKYGLDPGGNQPATKLSRKQLAKQADEDDDIIEIQSDEEWKPYNKKRKVTPSISRSKALNCNVCKMEFTDLNQFMIHLKQHKESKDTVPTPNEVKVESDIPKSFKCGCCTLSFDRKETLAVHMKLHTGDKQLNRPFGTAALGETVSLQKTNFPSNSNDVRKLYPKPTSQTVVDMKLAMDAHQKIKSTGATKDSPSLEKPVTITQVTGKDSGGKVCLLALWNSGSCSDDVDFQNPTCGSASHASNSTLNAQQTSLVALNQEEMLIPQIIVKQSQDGVPEVVVSQPELNMSHVSQSQFQMATSVGPVVSQADTHIVTIPHLANAPAQIPGNISSSTQPLSHIVVSIPNQSSGNYDPSTLEPSGVMGVNSSSENKGVILNTSDNKLSRALIGTGLNSDLDQKFLVLSSGNLNEQSSNSFQAQLSNKSLDRLSPTFTDENNGGNECSKGNTSMPSLDDDIVQTVTGTMERTIIEHDEMGNIAIVNVNSVEGSDPVYKEDETDWFLASEQSNACLEPPDTLWGNQETDKSGIAGIDQVDGMRPSSTLSFQLREQGDSRGESVDEDEKSDYFTSRYIVDTETRRKAEELADAIFAAIKS